MHMHKDIDAEKRIAIENQAYRILHTRFPSVMITGLYPYDTFNHERYVINAKISDGAAGNFIYYKAKKNGAKSEEIENELEYASHILLLGNTHQFPYLPLCFSLSGLPQLADAKDSHFREYIEGTSLDHYCKEWYLIEKAIQNDKMLGKRVTSSWKKERREKKSQILTNFPEYVRASLIASTEFSRFFTEHEEEFKARYPAGYIDPASWPERYGEDWFSHKIRIYLKGIMQMVQEFDPAGKERFNVEEAFSELLRIIRPEDLRQFLSINCVEHYDAKPANIIITVESHKMNERMSLEHILQNLKLVDVTEVKKIGIGPIDIINDPYVEGLLEQCNRDDHMPTTRFDPVSLYNERLGDLKGYTPITEEHMRYRLFFRSLRNAGLRPEEIKYHKANNSREDDGTPSLEGENDFFFIKNHWLSHLTRTFSEIAHDKGMTGKAGEFVAMLEYLEEKMSAKR
ncbi:MAG: hypothetical protein V1743_02325 [Nanoarchaeota archaeon]